MPPQFLDILSALPIRTFVATFLNGKKIVIKYTFDPTRTREECVLVNLLYLLPVLHGVLPSDVNEITNVSRLIIPPNVCSGYKYACCPCHLVNDSDEEAYENFVKPLVDECEFGHFHHFCTQHIVSWLYHYLNPMILFRESKEMFEEEIAVQYRELLRSDSVYFRTRERPISEFLLRNAEDLV